MIADDVTLGRILDLANFASDVPLTSLMEDAAFEPLIALLHSSLLDPDEDVDEAYRILIAESLFTVGNLAIEPLIAYIQHEPIGDELDRFLKINPIYEHNRNQSRCEIAELLGNYGDETAFSGLLDIIQIGEYRIVIASVASSIIQLNEDKGIAVLADILLNHSDPYIRRVIADVFARHASSDVTLPLILALEDSIAFVAKATIHALAKIKSKSALPFLIQATSDYRQIEVRTIDEDFLALAAINAVQSYQTEESQQIVFEWCVDNLKNDDDAIRRWAIEKLGTLADRRAIPFLFEALHDERNNQQGGYQSVFYATQEALREIGTPEALAALEEWQSKQE